MSLIIFPVILFPSLFILPASLISNATAFAFLVDVVFKFTLYANRKSLADIAVAPDFFIDSLYAEGPKSGFHLLSCNFFLSPSYSPDLQFARFFLSKKKSPKR